jgi:hypothetical protein
MDALAGCIGLLGGINRSPLGYIVRYSAIGSAPAIIRGTSAASSLREREGHGDRADVDCLHCLHVKCAHDVVRALPSRASLNTRLEKPGSCGGLRIALSVSEACPLLVGAICLRDPSPDCCPLLLAETASGCDDGKGNQYSRDPRDRLPSSCP